MAISNGKFKGSIDGKSIWDYNVSYKGICEKGMSIEELENELYNRMINIYETLNINLDNKFSMDEFWEEIWDKGCCKSNISTKEHLWSDTNVAAKLESLATYILMPYEIISKKQEELINSDEVVWNYSRPKEFELSDDIVHQGNYRLSPKESIVSEDLNYRKPFKRDYTYYKDVVYKKLDDKLRNKIKNDLISRYGHFDGAYEYTPYELMSFEKWQKLKDNEDKKIELLKDADDNLKILNNQLSSIKCGNVLIYNTNADENLNIKVDRYEEEKRIIKLSKQLQRFGLNNDKVKELEDKTYHKIDKKVNVNLNHITNNISDIKDYMIQVKLAYNNRVKINPDKCPNVKHAVELVDYTNVNHVKALLMLPDTDTIDPFDYLSPLAYDMTQMIRKLCNDGVLSERDMYIIEGYKYGVSQEQLAEELEVTKQNISLLINRISRNITQGFKDDEEDLLYLNDLYGTYKQCSKCNKIKLIQRFDRNGKKGYRSNCKRCN